MLNAVMNTYKRYPLTLTRGSGSYVYDDKEREYLDFTSGIATCNLGHVPPLVEARVSQQLAKLWHCSNLFVIPSQQALAQQLVAHSCLDQVFFCNSGAEANETGIKIARKYAKEELGREGGTILSCEQSFHGRTMATLTATGQAKFHAGFGPLLSGFRYVPFNAKAAYAEIEKADTIAFLLELVQGEGGVIPACQGWVKDIAKLCSENKVLLMIDEVQTGMGRTGSLFAYQQYGIEPDMVSLAKGLGSGFPIGALLAKAHVAQVLTPGSHGSTFGGNPLTTTAALATLEQMVASGFLAEVQDKSDFFLGELQKLAAKYPQITEIRGAGFLLGIEIPGCVQDVVASAREHGLLLLVAGERVVRVLPPLTASKEELQTALVILDQVMAGLS